MPSGAAALLFFNHIPALGARSVAALQDPGLPVPCGDCCCARSLF